MRVFKALMASGALVAATLSSTLWAQDPPVQVEISTSESHSVWYTNPLWLVIGGVILILIIALIVSANRGGTTVIKD